MKKATIEALYNYINGATLTNLDEIKSELETELNRGKAQKEANAKAYAGIHDLIIETLSDTPATAAEIFEAIEDELPDGMGKGKVQYALNNLWQDEIVKIEGKPNTYRRA